MTLFSTSQAKAEALDNTGLFDVHRWSDYPEVNAAVNHLFAIIQNNVPSLQEKKNKKTLKIILLDLLANWYANPDRYSVIHRGKSFYQGSARYNKLHFKYDVMVKVIDELENTGYIEQHKGFYRRSDPESSRATRIRATRKLIDILILDYQIVEGMTEKAPDTECIILRDRKGDKQADIDYTDNGNTSAMRRDLYRYNNLLRRHFISIPEVDRFGIPTASGIPAYVTQNEKFVRRIFNNGSWENGGRYYGGWWQRIPKEWRKKIRIWDLPTVEVDYSGLHVVLMYALKGIDYWQVIRDDPYSISTLEQTERMRALLKLVLLTAINSQTKQKAIKAVRMEVNTEPDKFAWVKHEQLNIGNVIDRFIEAHKPISEYFFSGVGVKLQYMDALIAEEIVNYFTQINPLPILCVHDSFIIEASHRAILEERMIEAVLRAKEKIAELTVLPELRRKVAGINLTQKDILSSSPEWLREAEQIRSLYTKYPEWCQAMEEFDEFQHREDYREEYYAARESYSIDC